MYPSLDHSNINVKVTMLGDNVFFQIFFSGRLVRAVGIGTRKHLCVTAVVPKVLVQ